MIIGDEDSIQSKKTNDYVKDLFDRHKMTREAHKVGESGEARKDDD